RFEIEAGGSRTLRLRFRRLDEARGEPFGAEFDRTFETRREEHDRYFADLDPAAMSKDEALVVQRAYAGLLWSKQFYHYAVHAWIEGDPDQPPPPAARKKGRNADWQHFYSRDVLSMPDTWEYPWFAAWDTAF